MTSKQQLIRRFRHGAHGVRLFFGIAVTISSAACAPSPDQHRTVEFYRANAEARQTKVAECANDPGALGKTPDCVNARQAAAIEDVGSLRDLPPMGLSPGTAQKDGKRPDAAGSSSQPDTSGQPR